MSCTSELVARISRRGIIRLESSSPFYVRIMYAPPRWRRVKILPGEDGKSYADTNSDGSANGAELVRGLTERWQVLWARSDVT